MTRSLIHIFSVWWARSKSLTGCTRTTVCTCLVYSIKNLRRGFSPEGCQECAVVSEDVGNFLVRVVVVRVLHLEVADDVPLAPLMADKAHIHIWVTKGKTCGGGNCWRFTRDSHPESGPPPGSAALSPGRPAAGGWSRLWLPLTSDPCTPSSSSSHCGTTSAWGTWRCGSAGLCRLRTGGGGQRSWAKRGQINWWRGGGS